MKKTLLFVAVSVASILTLILTGCSKKNDSNAYTAKQLAGTYKATASTATATGIGTIDLYKDWSDCEKARLQILKDNNTYAFVDVCDDDTTTGKFVIKGNLLISDPDNYPDTVTIKSFDGTNLVFTVSETYLGVTYQTTTTVTKQR